MTTRPDANIDAEILSVATCQWKKVAMIVATVVHGRDKHASHQDYELVAQRIADLVKSGRLESQGDLSRWRHSEVRLKNAGPSLAATPNDDRGSASEKIKLAWQAVREAPTSLPHLYELAVLLMDDERWPEADTLLDQLIQLSEQQNESYFLDEARFRKIMCLKSLGQFDDIPALKAKIPPHTEIFVDDGKYRVEDL